MGRGQFRDMPADFEAYADEPINILKARYRAGHATVRRWRDLCGVEIGRGRPGRIVIRTDKRGKERAFFSIREAATHTAGADSPKICAALRREGRSCGYWWRYAE